MALMYYIEYKKGYEIVGEPVEFVDTSEFVQIVAHALEGDYKIFTHLIEVELQPELELCGIRTVTMTIKLENGVEVVGDMKDYYLMAEYDYHLIPDPADYLLFIAGLYARIGMQKSVYPEELFNVGKINPWHV